MKVAVTIQHPAHVHFFKHTIRQLRSDDHRVAVFVREKALVVDLLSNYGIPYTVLSRAAKSRWRLVSEQLRYEYRLLSRIRRWKPDVVTAIGGVEASHVARVTGVPSVIFTDSELRSNWLMAPFADVICTPRRFGMEFGDGHLRYDGFHELAYLHPRRFQPDPDLLRSYGVEPDEPFFVLRFSDMRAHHDIGETGLSKSGKRTLVSTLEDHGVPYIATENSTDGARSLPVPPHHFHHLLAHADLVVSDSSTTATEAAILGVPTVRTNSFAAGKDMSNFEELADEYGLVYSTPDEMDAIARCRSILSDSTSGNRWQKRRCELLKRKIDVSELVTALVTTVGRAASLPASASEVARYA